MMMTNLFSMFDPSLIFFNFAWAPCFLPLVVLFYSVLCNKSFKWTMSISVVSNFLVKEVSALMRPHEKKLSTKLMASLFFSCLSMNLIAMTPFSFTPTAHLSISLTLSMSFWMALMMMGWSKNFFGVMSHLVPLGTPMQLMNFMVLIEVASNFIRPITLAIRLSANMVAGHLLMSLLGSFLLSATWLKFFPVMVGLSTLEVGVSLIQAYVFMMLVSLYSTEIH